MRTHSLIKITLLGLLLLGANSGSQALAQDADAPRTLQVDDYFALKSVGSPQVSPDGAWVAYTVGTKDLEKDRRETRLWMVSTAGGEAIPMTAKGSSIWRPRWSPDGKYLTFMAGGSDKGSQVFTLDLRGGERVQITSVEHGVEGYEWSPDGKRLALMIRDQGPEEESGPWVIDRLQFKEDYEGYMNRLRAHVYVYDIETKAIVQITSGDYEDYGPAWSPNGNLIAFSSNRTDEPDANYNSDIWLVKPNTSYEDQEPVRVTSNPGADDGPMWHPDGKRIAYSTTIKYELANYAQYEVAIIRVGKDKPVVLTESLDRNAFDPVLSKDGSKIYFQLEDDGMVNLAAVSVDDGSLSRPIAGRRAVGSVAEGPNGAIVARISEPQLPIELFVLDAGASASSGLRRLTHVNDGMLQTITLSDAEEARFQSTDGTTEIQAFIYKPTSYDPKRRYPTLLWLHGGQESQYDYSFNFRVQLFAANGYVVVMPNVRGSGGRGEKFALSNWQNWGKYDAQDVLAATDHAVTLDYVDPERLGIGGWSYGGCLTNWVITISDRFEGAISGAGNSQWLANYGHDRYQKWYALELGLPWETRERWENASPFNKVQNITTPTLWIGAEKDWNVPVINSEQMYQAMKKLGRETLLVVYPDSHHGVRKHSYQKDLLGRFLGWFDKYVKHPQSAP